jgi:hypothetical protein
MNDMELLQKTVSLSKICIDSGLSQNSLENFMLEIDDSINNADSIMRVKHFNSKLNKLLVSEDIENASLLKTSILEYCEMQDVRTIKLEKFKLFCQFYRYYPFYGSKRMQVFKRSKFMK